MFINHLQGSVKAVQLVRYNNKRAGLDAFNGVNTVD